jgi:carboxymethylenebutenolidase
VGQTLQLATARMQCIGAYRADPPGPARGGIVVVQEIFGVNAHVRSVVDRFAAHGFVAIAPAMFDHVETGVELGYDERGVKKGRELAG